MKPIPRLMVAALLPVVAQDAAAQPGKSDYPQRPIRLLVAQSAGGNADFVSRLIAVELTKAFGQQVVVDNRPGASGIIATEMTVKAVPDGYTVLLVGSAFGTNPSVFRKLPYDPMRDLAPVTQPANASNILVVNVALPVSSVKDLIALARAKPNSLNFGSSGSGGSGHLSGELFKLMTGTELTHIPYKGAAAALTDLIAGQIQLDFASMPSVMGHLRSNRLRALAVTSLKRAQALPEMPTMAESGLPGFEAGAWQGVFVPARSPHVVIATLHREIVRIVNLPDVRKQLAADGAEPVGNTPEAFAAWLRVEIARWAKVVKAANLYVD
jgi:tripartite-type tricarboxylate transporter receptor subunit TctC